MGERFALWILYCLLGLAALGLIVAAIYLWR
jgi:hypothetical protein